VQERTVGVVGGLARKEIGYLYHTILVEKLGLKDLNGQRLNVVRPREAKGAYVRGRKVALLGGEIYGWSDREVTALVLVEDASEEGGGVEVRNAIGLDLRGGLVRFRREIGLQARSGGHTGAV